MNIATSVLWSDLFWSLSLLLDRDEADDEEDDEEDREDPLLLEDEEEEDEAEELQEEQWQQLLAQAKAQEGGIWLAMGGDGCIIPRVQWQCGNLI